MLERKLKTVQDIVYDQDYFVVVFAFFCLEILYIKTIVDYNSFLVYCREMAPGTVS